MTLIVPLTPTTAKTCLRIRPPGCGTLPLRCTGWRVRVQRVQCTQVVPNRVYDCQPSCWAMGEPPTTTPRDAPSPVIEYRVFDIDAEGRVCFYWDDKLLAATPGRYGATLLDAAGTKLGYFELDVKGTQVVIDQASTVEAISTCEDCDK